MQSANLREFDQFYQFKDTPNNITAIFSNRKLDFSFANQSESQIKKNRAFFLSKLDLNLDQLVCAKQTHSDNVYIVDKKDKSRGAVRFNEAIDNTDAFITKEKDIALSIFIADCLPIFIVDIKKDIVALVHAGWKSTKKSLIKKTIFVMQQAFGSQPEDIKIFFGPAIRKCCYEVGEEFLDYFKRGTTKKDNKIYLDLVKINYLQLKELGILESNIFDSEICTFCQNDKFFSYRREKKSSGRQMALIVTTESRKS